MIEAEAISQMNEILGRRREYFRQFERGNLAAKMKFTDVDYAFAWYLIARLGITSIQADTAEVAGLFSASLLPVSVAGAGGTPPSARDGKPFGLLYLFSPPNRPSVDWLKGASNPGCITLCYGLADAMGNELAETTRNFASASDPSFFMPLFGNAPGLWRAASMLIGCRGQQAVLAGVMRKFIAAFSGDDLDPLLLAEENVKLRVQVQRLSMPGTNEAEVRRLQSVVASLEAFIASLRRGAVQQEKTIAAMKKFRGEAILEGGHNGHPSSAGK